ncbi:MAG: hypothetical protein ALECFALPRED_005257 [Alectoria fallacina]|uniref:Methyltransferase n=1 Tax=Alectoria fallacina TaxID=1903189 RepID=A0A8H3IXD1_9LECA|nr:MAG: hypothetical protein ALECFALPRED_005257 [Alectoria fallacina]
MSAPTAAEEQNQTSEIPFSAPTQAAHAETQPGTEAEVQAVQSPIQAEGDIAIDDSNSAYSDDLSTYTASLSSSVLNFPTENGRRYHAFREGTYVFPNDESEQDRMDLHHEMIMKACGGKLHLAPLTNPGRILDIGTGTGIWCIEMGDTYPDAEVIGNDFSPVQPNMVPRNVKFEVDDVEAPWTHQTKFDYIHSRFMAGSIADWPKLVRTCYDNLNPGGIVEFVDGDFLIYSEDGSTKDSWWEKWNIDIARSARMGGRIMRPGPQLEDWKEVGAFNLVQLREGLEGFSLALFTRILGWSPEEVQVLLSKVRKDMENRNMHAQNDIYVVWGRRPSV